MGLGAVGQGPHAWVAASALLWASLFLMHPGKGMRQAAMGVLSIILLIILCASDPDFQVCCTNALLRVKLLRVALRSGTKTLGASSCPCPAAAHALHVRCLPFLPAELERRVLWVQHAALTAIPRGCMRACRLAPCRVLWPGAQPLLHLQLYMDAARLGGWHRPGSWAPASTLGPRPLPQFRLGTLLWEEEPVRPFTVLFS
jgi:hypothetical protein